MCMISTDANKKSKNVDYLFSGTDCKASLVIHFMLMKALKDAKSLFKQ